MPLMPAPTTQFFTGQMPFLSPNQQRQSTEDSATEKKDWLNQKWVHKSNLLKTEGPASLTLTLW